MACAEKIHFRSHLFPTAATLLHKSSEDEKGRRGFRDSEAKAPLQLSLSSLDLPNSYICIKIRLSSQLAFRELRNIGYPKI